MRRALLLLVALLAGCGGAGAGGDGGGGGLLLSADHVFDGRRDLGRASVLVRGGRVVAVGRGLAANGARQVDLGDATLLPGLIDLHVHDEPDAEVRLGVTTVRNLGAPLGELGRQQPAGGPRVLAAGPILTVRRGYLGTTAIGLPVTSPRSARRAVRLLVRRGAAVIKIALEDGGVLHAHQSMLTVAEVRAIVDEAHRAGRIVTAHALEAAGVRVALAARVDELAHVPCHRAYPELMRTLAARRIPVVATLHVAEVAPIDCRRGLANARTFAASGGTLLYGTDLGNAGVPVGPDVRELQLLVAAGLSRGQALAAATSRAGRELGLAPLGSLVAGAPADLWAVRGDALADLAALRRPVLVVRAGRVMVG